MSNFITLIKTVTVFFIFIYSKFACIDLVDWLPAGGLHDGEARSQADDADPVHPLFDGLGAAGHVQGCAHALRRPTPHRLRGRNG